MARHTPNHAGEPVRVDGIDALPATHPASSHDVELPPDRAFRRGLDRLAQQGPNNFQSHSGTTLSFKTVLKTVPRSATPLKKGEWNGTMQKRHPGEPLGRGSWAGRSKCNYQLTYIL